MALLVNTDNDIIFKHNSEGAYCNFTHDILVNTDSVYSYTFDDLFTLEKRNVIKPDYILTENNSIIFIYSNFICVWTKYYRYNVNIRLDDKFRSKFQCGHIAHCNVDELYIFNGGKLEYYVSGTHKETICDNIKQFIRFIYTDEGVMCEYINQNGALCRLDDNRNLETDIEYNLIQRENFVIYRCFLPHPLGKTIYTGVIYKNRCEDMYDDNICNMKKIVGSGLFEDKKGLLWRPCIGELKPLQLSYKLYIE